MSEQSTATVTPSYTFDPSELAPAISPSASALQKPASSVAGSRDRSKFFVATGLTGVILLGALVVTYLPGDRIKIARQAQSLKAKEQEINVLKEEVAQKEATITFQDEKHRQLEEAYDKAQSQIDSIRKIVNQ